MSATTSTPKSAATTLLRFSSGSTIVISSMPSARRFLACLQPIEPPPITTAFTERPSPPARLAQSKNQHLHLSSWDTTATIRIENKNLLRSDTSRVDIQVIDSKDANKPECS